jgi:hypothetical protein
LKSKEVSGFESIQALDPEKNSEERTPRTLESGI